MFVCFKCRAAFAQYKLLARHLRHHHSLKTKAQAKTQLTCVQDGCNQQFQSPAAFRKHLVKHSNNCEGNCCSWSLLYYLSSVSAIQGTTRFTVTGPVQGQTSTDLWVMTSLGPLTRRHLVVVSYTPNTSLQN